MFDEYLKKLESIEANVPKVFKTIAKKGAIHARNEAVKLTDQERLVDTGNYRRNWNGEAIEPQKEVYGIILENGVEYASFLEDGHKLRNGKRWKGRKVGERALQYETRFYCLDLLNKMFEKLYTKYHQSFTNPPDSQ